MNEVKIVAKILKSMTENFNFVAFSIEESNDIDLLIVDKLQILLLVHEEKLRKKQSEKQVMQVEHDTHYGRGRGRSHFQRGSNNYVERKNICK